MSIDELGAEDKQALDTANRPRILVVEDNPVNLELLVIQLDMLKYITDQAIDGVEALEKWNSADYAILLTDIRMPKLDGYRVIESIRAGEPPGHRSPIIAVTANAMPDDVQRCFEVGADDVLLKPVSLEDLQTMLRKWIL